MDPEPEWSGGVRSNVDGDHDHGRDGCQRAHWQPSAVATSSWHPAASPGRGTTSSNRPLAGGLALLGGLVVVYAVLGPLVLDVIHFRTSASGLNQIRGGDLAALARRRAQLSS